MTKSRKNKNYADVNEGTHEREHAAQVVTTTDTNNDGVITSAPAPALAPKPPSKQQQLAALVVRDEGAMLDQMIAATGWLPHSTRAALTGLQKKGYVLSSDKVDGVRSYRAVARQ